MKPTTGRILATLRKSKTRYTPEELTAFFTDVRALPDAALIAAYNGPATTRTPATPLPAWHASVAEARHLLGARQSRFVELIMEQLAGDPRLAGYAPAASHRSSLPAFLNALAKRLPQDDIVAAARSVARAKALIYQAA